MAGEQLVDSETPLHTGEALSAIRRALEIKADLAEAQQTLALVLDATASGCRADRIEFAAGR